MKQEQETLTPVEKEWRTWWENLIAKFSSGSCTVWGQGSMEGAFKAGFKAGAKSVSVRPEED